MASQPITMRRVLILEEWGEECVFDLYLELGSVAKVLEELFPEIKNGHNSRAVFHKWLDQEEGRAEKYQRAKRILGEIHADKAIEVANEATRITTPQQRLKFDAHKWKAGVLNPEFSQKAVEVNVLNVPQQWLAGMKAAEVQEARVIEPKSQADKSVSQAKEIEGPSVKKLIGQAKKTDDASE